MRRYQYGYRVFQAPPRSKEDLGLWAVEIVRREVSPEIKNPQAVPAEPVDAKTGFALSSDAVAWGENMAAEYQDREIREASVREARERANVVWPEPVVGQAVLADA